MKTNRKKYKKGLFFKIIIVIIIILIIIVGGRYLFNKVNKDKGISGVRKILNTKYSSITCLYYNCDSLVAVHENSEEKVSLVDLDGKIINIKLDNSSKQTEIPSELSEDYYITVITNNSNEKMYYIKDINGKKLYSTKYKLNILNENLILMDNNSKYSIINKEGKIIYDNVVSIKNHLNGKYFESKINNKDYIINEKGVKILNGYTIYKILYNDYDEAYAFIIKNEEENNYNYYSINKNQVVGNSFDSYVQNDDEITIIKNKNDKKIAYKLLENGKQKKISSSQDILKKLKTKIKSKYIIYENSIYDDNQNYVIVDNKDNKSFGILNIKNNKYTKIYNYDTQKNYFSSYVNKINSDSDEKYLKIICSSSYCGKYKTIIYDLDKRKILYSIDDISIENYIGYDEGYKVIHFNEKSDNKYSNKFVIFDKNNKKLFISNDNIIISDKKLKFGNQSNKSVFLYSVSDKTVLNKEKVSLKTLKNTKIYSYIDNENNTYIYNNKGKFLLKIPKVDYVYLMDDNYIYIEDNYIKIYNLDKEKLYKYKIAKNENTNNAIQMTIKPYNGAIFINNSKDKYAKIINYKGKTIKKINDAQIYSTKNNSKSNNIYIVVRKEIESKRMYGLYIAQ